MRSITATETTTIDEFIAARWSNDPSTAAAYREMLHYRNRLRWANVMPAVVAAMPALWEHRFGPEWATFRERFPYFELAQMEKVFAAVLDGTGRGVDYAIDQLFGPESAHITRPMLSTMWKRYLV